jgi:hypothetical protein
MAIYHPIYTPPRVLKRGAGAENLTASQTSTKATTWRARDCVRLAASPHAQHSPTLDTIPLYVIEPTNPRPQRPAREREPTDREWSAGAEGVRGRAPRHLEQAQRELRVLVRVLHVPVRHHVLQEAPPQVVAPRAEQLLRGKKEPTLANIILRTTKQTLP